VLQTGQMDDKMVNRLVELDFPMVFAGRPFHADGISYIDVDNLQAAQNAVCHLIRHGYQRIGTITGRMNSTTGIDRLEGYRKAILEQGWEVDESLIKEGDFSEASGYAAMKLLLPAKPDAVFAASDALAFGAIRAVQEAGYNVPRDVAFVGFDDLPIASQSEIQLTTVRQPIVQFGVKAVETLIDLIEYGIKPTRRIIMETELIIRESCGASQMNGHLSRYENVPDHEGAPVSIR
jgi:LacI family transcriptional regulator